MLGSRASVLYFAFHDKEQVSIALHVFSNAGDMPPFLSHRVELLQRIGIRVSKLDSVDACDAKLNCLHYWSPLALENLLWPAPLRFSRGQALE